MPAGWRRRPWRVALGLAALLAVSGCSTLEQRDRTDAGFEHAKAGLAKERAGDLAGALAEYEAGERELLAALTIADEKADAVAQRLIHMKLNHVRMGRGRCFEPPNDAGGQGGGWTAAREAYAAATEDALAGRFLKLAKEGYVAQAGCLRPDRNPEGSWPQAAALYARAAETAAEYHDPAGRAAALLEQAVCLLEGDRARLGGSGEARELVEEASDLGDKEAARWLASLGGAGAAPAPRSTSPGEAATCAACAATLPAGAKFCPACGAKVEPAVCGECGAALTPKANFCAACGAKAR